MTDQNSTDDVYAVVANIPAEYHSADLRNYFSMFIEDAGFTCFHFRHRPEVRQNETTGQVSETHTSSLASLRNAQPSNVLETLSKWGHAPVTVTKPVTNPKRDKRNCKTCCVVKVKASRIADLLRMYHRKHWLDRAGDSVSALCQITRVNTKSMSSSANARDNTYKTKAERKRIPSEREQFTATDLEKLPELHPPDIMPNGNVGTPTRTFLRFIKECRLPPQVIAKLGLKFPRTRTNKMYSKVHFDYGEEVNECPDKEEETIQSADGKELLKEGEKLTNLQQRDTIEGCNRNEEGDSQKETRKRKRGRVIAAASDSDEGKSGSNKSDSDSDDCEDYERHEALHSDVANHVERNKERLFESEIELKWEKGGSGLVFYTDAQYWDAQKGDFDERTADDWDVDMEIYTDHRAGDKDARDFMLMRQETRRRAGKEDTDMYTAGIGKFEKHTKGVGRRVLERQGWAEGQGLGPSSSGISDALHNEGQKPFERAGLGYLGEKLDRSARSGPKRRRRQPEDVIISTIYDDPEETDPQEPLYRTNDHHLLTWRHSFLSAGIQGGRTDTAASDS